MAKTLKQHLKKYGYKPTAADPYGSKEAEDAYQFLVRQYGEDNVWDFRILDQAFDVSESSFAWGIMFNARKLDTDEHGSLSQTGFTPGAPRFYYDFVVDKNGGGS